MTSASGASDPNRHVSRQDAKRYCPEASPHCPHIEMHTELCLTFQSSAVMEFTRVTGQYSDGSPPSEDGLGELTLHVQFVVQLLSSVHALAPVAVAKNACLALVID